MDLLKWIIGMFILFGIAWFISGGGAIQQRPFLTPPVPLGSGQQYGPSDAKIKTSSLVDKTKIDDEDEHIEDESISIFDGDVSFGRRGPSTNDVALEYITLNSSRRNLQPINITNWVLKSAVSGKSVIIGSGSYLPYSGRVNREDPIFLRPGGTAIITTGSSPIGVSFRLNICIGYFEQFQDFSPSLRKECPLAINEDYTVTPGGIDNFCLEHIDDIKMCEFPVSSIGYKVNEACRDFISETINYNGCVKNHKDDDTFYKDEWRIFLGQSSELWNEKYETILLIDDEGKMVDSISY